MLENDETITKDKEIIIIIILVFYKIILNTQKAYLLVNLQLKK